MTRGFAVVFLVLPLVLLASTQMPAQQKKDSPAITKAVDEDSRVIQARKELKELTDEIRVFANPQGNFTPLAKAMKQKEIASKNYDYRLKVLKDKVAQEEDIARLKQLQPPDGTAATPGPLKDAKLDQAEKELKALHEQIRSLTASVAGDGSAADRFARAQNFKDLDPAGKLRDATDKVKRAREAAILRQTAITTATSKDVDEKATAKATANLKYAKTLIGRSDLPKAKQRLEEVVKEYPETEAAKEAAALLKKHFP